MVAPCCQDCCPTLVQSDCLQGEAFQDGQVVLLAWFGLLLIEVIGLFVGAIKVLQYLDQAIQPEQMELFMPTTRLNWPGLTRQ